eukprot:COSAG03_NODE_493_length_7437_cov_2.232216_6_plen_46_part_00
MQSETERTTETDAFGQRVAGQKVDSYCTKLLYAVTMRVIDHENES